MKRDMNLIARILQSVENDESTPDFGEVSLDTLTGHALLCMEQGWVEGRLGQDGTAQIDRLTWSGHDVLDQMRVPTCSHCGKSV